jgi:hypothetical protein
MTTLATRPGPNGRARPSLGDQLDRLDGILNGLSDALNESVTAAVSAAVGKEVREAIEAATRELAARSAASPAGIDETEMRPQRRLGRRALARSRAVARRLFAPVGHRASRFFRRLGAPLVVSVRRTMRAPGRFAALALVGAAAGTAAGFVGPLVGAAVGGLAGSAMILITGRPR